MPVMLAGRISSINIDIYNVPNYPTMIMHGGPSRISISLAERSVGGREKSFGKIFKCTIRGHDKSCAYPYDTEERIGNLSSGHRTFRGIRLQPPAINPGMGRGGNAPTGCRRPAGR